MKKIVSLFAVAIFFASALTFAFAAPTAADATTNYCGFIYSPGYWKNWSNHYTAAEFQALIDATPHFAGMTIADVEAALRNNRNQFQRHLMSAELNVALNPEFANGSYMPFGGLPVLYVLGAAVEVGATSELDDAIRYLGSNGEGSSSANCRVQAEER